MSELAQEAGPARSARPFSRAAFRARLDADPRPWVLALAAGEGLVGFALAWNEELSRPGPGYLLLVPLGYALVSPAVAILALLLHGRLTLWTGRLLGGRARPSELHAALAWSQLPLLVVGWPAALRLASRIATAEHDPVPRWLAVADHVLGEVVGWSGVPVAAAAVLGVVLSVGYLAEAQRFTVGRAVANHVLAALLGIAFPAAAIGLWALTTS